MRRSVRGRCFRLATILACCAATAVSPPTPQDRTETIRLLLRQDIAVATVGERLRIRLVGWCSRRGATIGIGIGTLSQYGSNYQAEAQRTLRLGRYPTVTFVIPGGAAAVAGIQPGEQVVSIDGAVVPESDLGSSSTASLEHVLDAMDDALSDEVVSLGLVREEVHRSLTIRATPACRVRYEVRAGSGTNASSDGSRIQISSDLADPARQDEDIAPLLAHEFSHVLLNHSERLRSAYRGLLPGFGKRGRALRDSEIGADRLSVYVLMRAGYRPSDAIEFWSRFARRTDRGILSDRTHPDWRARVAAIRAEVDRAAGLRAGGQPVVPPADLFVSPS